MHHTRPNIQSTRRLSYQRLKNFTTQCPNTKEKELCCSNHKELLKPHSTSHNSNMILCGCLVLCSPIRRNNKIKPTKLLLLLQLLKRLLLLLLVLLQ